MHVERAALVIGLTILVVVVFNVMIYLAWRDKSLSEMVNMFRRAAQSANDPWKDEDASLSELNQLVKQLHKDDPQDELGEELSAKISEVPNTSEISANQNGEPGEKRQIQ